MHLKDSALKPVRGKRLIVKVSAISSYEDILEKAKTKFQAYFSNHVFESEQYVLLLESGSHAQFMPGTTQPFCLNKYREETGKDYKRIVLYLCTLSDFQEHEHGDEFEGILSDEEDITEISEEKEPKRKKLCVSDDEMLAIQLQAELNDPFSYQDETHALATPSTSDQPMATNFLTCESMVNSLKVNIDQTNKFTIVARRGVSLARMFSLWKREVIKTSPECALTVKFAGEIGNDGGAISKEFLTTIIDKMKLELFPDGIPIDSMLNVHNGTYFTAGQISAVSIVQGGPPPALFDKSVYNMFTKPVSINELQDEHFSSEDLELFKEIKANPSLKQDVITDHGYSGVINAEHVDDIIGTVKVSIISRRLVYLSEFKKGLNLFGLSKALNENVEVCKELFLRQSKPVDANYVVSILCPEFSEHGSNRRPREEAVFDNFQDFLMATEDENITALAEEIVWDGMDGDDDEVQCCHSQLADISPGGVLGWLTGQKHQPMDGESLSVSVKFDHECMEQEPLHRICFPLVGACARVITLPVQHMLDPSEFRRVMLLAFCKGQAFSRF